MGSYTANSIDPDVVADWVNEVYWKGGSAQAGFSDVVTYARASTATYMDSSGDWQSASSGTARVGHYNFNGSTFDNVGMFFESVGSTNLREDSEGTTGLRLGSDVTFTGSDEDSPLGTNNATRIATNTDDSNHIWDNGGETEISVTNNNWYAISHLIKARGSQVYVGMTGDYGGFDGTNRYIGTDMSDWSIVDVSTNCTGYVEEQGNDWARSLFVLQADSNANIHGGYGGFGDEATIPYPDYAGDAADGIWHDGFQFEDVTGLQMVTSYIPTSGATASRAAATMSVEAADLGTIGTDVSFVLHGSENYADLATADQVLLFDLRADASNRFTLSLDTDTTKTGTLTFTVVDGGTSSSVSATVELAAGINKSFAVACRATDSYINIALNGTAETEVSNSAGDLPDVSSADVDFAGMGARGLFTMVLDDLGDTGIETASDSTTYPSEPSSEHTLLADDVESASEVTTPAVGQVHALLADDTQSTSEVTAPTLGQVHAILADDTESASEVSAPAIGQAHPLLADDVESTSEVTSPVVGQAHILLASDAESASEVTSPTAGQVHVLLADDVESASEVSTPTAAEDTGEIALLADDVESASEVTSPTVGQVHILLSVSIESLSELGSPRINAGAPNADRIATPEELARLVTPSARGSILTPIARGKSVTV